MTFEDDLRTTLQAEARELDLRGRGAIEVVHRARRRQHRARRVGAVAAVGVLTAGTVAIVGARGSDGDGVAVSSWAQDIGLPEVGPLELSWQTVEGGISGGLRGEPVFTEDAAGAIYALSTAPGTRVDPASGESPPAALYRLGADGVWVPASGDGTVPPLADITADGTVLYALSTSPGSGAVGYDTVLSTSIDGGTTWTTASVTPVDPPSTTVVWEAATTLAIERVPGATAALVTTNFFVSRAVVAEAAASVGVVESDTTSVSGEYSDAGLEIITWSTADPAGKPEPVDGPGGGSPPGTDDPEQAEIDETGATAPPGTMVAGSGRTVVTTIPWAQLGITGPADLGSHTQVLLRSGDAWTPVDAVSLQGLGVSGLRAIDGELVVTGWVDDRTTGGSTTDPRRTFASADGRTWRAVPLAGDSRLVGLGTAWIDVPWGSDGASPMLSSSTDRGATWQSIDLGAVDSRLAPTTVVSVDSSSLGLALVATDHHDGSAPSTSFLATTRDLTTWTITPLPDITGTEPGTASVFVGTDRVVVSATSANRAEPSATPRTTTAIGTPIR